jgi:GalNAc-alpha-(1->4)-GalNAc-alpha-(1->3)-diNAcBac-PP-undecaprenol alpha-1,4-N-acetyl-D-galactosaminyltransferase
MRLMFVARAVNQTAGGVERVLTMVMNALAARGHAVDLLTWDLAGAEPFYPMMAGITWHRLNMGDPHVRASNTLRLRRAQTVRTLIGRQRPDVIACFQDGPFMAMRAYSLGLHIPVVACERNAPSRFDHIAAARYRGLIYQSFRFAARVVIQCERYRSLYPNFLHRRITCIPNPVLPATVCARPDMPGPHGRYRLLSVGRLGFQKNYHVLIEAFARLASEFPNWDLAIIGDGEDRAGLEALIRERGLEHRIALAGTTKSIAQWYCSSHLFCLPSRWEGAPNALLEALAHGLPPVGFAECAGVRDLIAHRRSGLLAEGQGDADSLAMTLKAGMDSAALRLSMSRAAIESVRAFDPEEIFSQWERLLREVADH